MRNIDWVTIKAKVREAVVTLPHFFKNPVQGMRTIPHWEWPETLILQAIFSAACALIGNLIERDILGAITGVILAPISFFLLITIGSGFFYYVFKFFFHRDIPYHQVYMNVLFASIPMVLVTTVSFLLQPLLLVGAAAMAMLLFVGFVSNFQLPTRKMRNLLGTIFAIYTIFWIVTLIGNTNKHKTMRLKATPESVDILDKEMNE